MPTALVIEDDESSVTVLAHVLQWNGYTVLSTVDPDQAAQYCRQFKVDVIVSDVLLRSRHSGTEMVTMIRRACPEVPVLFVSGTPLEGWSESDFANIEAL